MKKILLLVLLALATATGVYLNPQWLGENGDQPLRLYGNVDIREVQLGFRVGGRLRQMHFEEGDRVSRGDLLAELDAQPLEEALAISQAGVLQAQARLDRTNTGSRPQEIQQSEARVTEAEAALANAVLELARQREMFDKGLSSKRSLDSAIALHDQDKARLAANREALGLAVEGFRKEDIAEAQAGLTAAMAQRDLAQTQVNDTRLYAPNAGVIQTRAREPGAMLSVGGPVYNLSLTDKIYVRAYVDESRLGKLAPGTAVHVLTDSSNKRYLGQVGFVSPRAEFTPKTVETPALRTDLVYRLRIVVANPDQMLMQGMPVTVEVAGSGG
jgi:HlyD family secretion protein